MDSDSEEFDESVFGLSEGDSEYEDVAVVGDAKPSPQTHQNTKLKFKQTSLRHLDELKNTLGLADFQDKAAKKSEKRRRQKERRKLKVWIFEEVISLRMKILSELLPVHCTVMRFDKF